MQVIGPWWVLKPIPWSLLPMSPRVFPCRFSLFLFSIISYVCLPVEHYFPYIVHVDARVCRSQDSWEWTDHPQIWLTYLLTLPKCSTRALLALINNLGILYHQYCSSSFPNSILKESWVSLSSLCDGSCNHCVHTIKPNTPISRYSSTDALHT